MRNYQNHQRPSIPEVLQRIIIEVNCQIEEDLFDIAYDLELKYDGFIDLIVFDKQALNGKFASAPIYEKVLSEGLSV